MNRPMRCLVALAAVFCLTLVSAMEAQAYHRRGGCGGGLFSRHQRGGACGYESSCGCASSCGGTVGCGERIQGGDNYQDERHESNYGTYNESPPAAPPAPIYDEQHADDDSDQTQDETRDNNATSDSHAKESDDQQAASDENRKLNDGNERADSESADAERQQSAPPVPESSDTAESETEAPREINNQATNPSENVSGNPQ